MIVFVSLLSYVLMILGSFFLNKRFRSENPDCHSYRWGFFMALYLAATGFLFVVGDLGGLYDAENSILIAVLTSGFIPALLTVTAFVAYGLFVQGLYKRNRFAWLFMIAIAALTSFSLTVLLVITSVTTGEGAGATLAVAIISFLVIVSHVFYVRKRWEELHRLRLPLSRAPSAGDPAPAGQAPQTGSTAPAVGQLQFNIPVTWAVGLVAVIILIPLSIFLTVGFDEGVEAEPSEVSQTSTPEPEETIESLAPEPVEVAQIPAPDPMAKVRQAEQFIDVENYARALPLFMEAAEGGIAQAQGRLGWMYNNGYGVPQNSQLSSVWSQRAAEQGDALGQAMLGYKYMNGDGVPRNYALSLQWSQLAADQGNAIGQANVGVMYANGWGVRQNESEAIRWYQLAADQGNTQAQLNLDRRNKQTWTCRCVETAFSDSAVPACFRSVIDDWHLPVYNGNSGENWYCTAN